MLLAYRFGLVRATERFRTIVVSCTFAVAAFYVIALVMAMFGLYIPFLHEGGPIGIGFSLLRDGAGRVQPDHSTSTGSSRGWVARRRTWSGTPRSAWW